MKVGDMSQSDTFFKQTFKSYEFYQNSTQHDDSANINNQISDEDFPCTIFLILFSLKASG
jgi:hypothetical protein